MIDDAPQINDDWINDPAPPPPPSPDFQQGRKSPARPLADQLRKAPVAAGPGQAKPKRGSKPSPAPDDDGPPDPPRPPPSDPDRDRGEIWDGCPVRALGVNGDYAYYLDRLGQLRAVKKHENQTIMSLFGDRIGLLSLHYPVYAKGADTPQRHRFDGTRASMAMITACAEKGLFNPDGAVRGVGAWRDDDGQLVYHLGDRLLTAEGDKPPGDHQGKIYPAYPSIPAPAADLGRADPAADILETAGRWAWHHPDVDPHLVLGMVCVQMMGGALEWRPTFWGTGDKASGKSTLHEMLKHLHGGDRGLVQSNDPTKSGITSRLGHSSLPVALDEIEPGEEGSRKEADLIVLARIASSGGQWLRGSSDQKGAGGNVYSSFFFSSILIPGSLTPQDRSRLITLNLDTLPADAPRLVLDPRTWRKRGAALKRLLIDRWPQFEARLSDWRSALADVGLTGRNGDNWATTMALADLALHPDPQGADILAGWAVKIARVARVAVDQIGSDAEDMIQHLIGQPLDVFRRGELFTVAQWVMVAAQLPSAPRELIASSDASVGEITAIEREGAARRANEKLAKYGLRVRGTGEASELFIANSPIPGLAKLFERSRWSGGVWAQSSRRCIGATPVPSPLTLAGQRLRGVYIPLKHVAGMLAFPMDRADSARPIVTRDDDMTAEDFV